MSDGQETKGQIKRGEKKVGKQMENPWGGHETRYIKEKNRRWKRGLPLTIYPQRKNISLK